MVRQVKSFCFFKVGGRIAYISKYFLFTFYPFLLSKTTYNKRFYVSRADE